MKLNFVLLHFQHRVHKLILLAKKGIFVTCLPHSLLPPVVDTDGGMRQEGHLGGSTEWSSNKEIKITSLCPSTAPADWTLWGSLHSLIVTAVTWVPVPTLSTDFAKMTQVPACLTGRAVTQLTSSKQRQKYVMGSYRSHSCAKARTHAGWESRLQSQEFSGTGYVYEERKLRSPHWPQKQDRTHGFSSF